ncbi:T9SS type A sorting domain-containing protein [Taibaiella koreensis]|uniref:T9SS type A sorting domain-containing protein n=1 Tax=Taibaiella koreensis TaxID=1268548 RepID=UPI00196952F7|nr:T9SS type A sorting domain-containing protein [Taibaiella koreensis]
MKRNTITAALTGLFLGNSLYAQIASGTIVVTPASIPSASYVAAPQPQGPGSTTQYTTNHNCEMIGTISSAANLGNVTASVTVNNAAFLFNGQPLVGRYYELHPSQNAQQSATVTLYFSQADFDAYNTLAATLGNSDYPPIDVATNPNLRITVFHGLPSDGTTGPNGQYNDAVKEVLTPGSIVHNGAGFYEVTFTTPGFSGFFAHTLNSTPLLIVLGDITAQNAGNRNRIEWSTLSEAAGDEFRIERSTDGSHFETIGSLDAKGKAPSQYSFIDEQPYTGVSYYRLYLDNAEKGTGTYSRIVAATMKGEAFAMNAYPNPAGDYLNISIRGGQDGKLLLMDAMGRQLLATQPGNGSTMLSMKHLAQGFYLVQYQDSHHSQTLKVYKK